LVRGRGIMVSEGANAPSGFPTVKLERGFAPLKHPL